VYKLLKIKPTFFFNRFASSDSFQRLRSYVMEIVIHGPWRIYTEVHLKIRRFKIKDHSFDDFLERSFLWFFKRYQTAKKVALITLVFPKIAIGITFLFDVFYFHELSWFYTSLYLLIGSIFVQAWVFMVKDMVDLCGYEITSEILEVTLLEDGRINCCFRDDYKGSWEDDIFMPIK
jgi:hypothetical protein